jgi:UDP-N-acetylmuramyl pentapeptide phosphotransferase/UDP-N-acetylglucosamine-1-phosphate transferase
MEIYLVVGAFIIAGFATCFTIPAVVKVANEKKLFDLGGGRKIHTQVVPPLGGVAIFIGFILSSIIATDGLSFDSLKYIIAAVILMFFIGLKDDLMDISPLKKFTIQGFAAVILITLGDVRFTSLHGILGVYEIDYFVSFVFTLLIAIAIINAYNLVDGIDGLASGLAIMAASVFGTWFYLNGHVQFSIMSFALVGSLSGFFIYNVFGKTNKVFMGDTGSLIIGLVISTLVIKFNEFALIDRNPEFVNVSPVISFSIVIVPIIDMLRVMTIRVSQGKSPFSADNNHLHHRLLKLNKNHIKVSLIIVSANFSLFGFALVLNTLSVNSNIQFFILMTVGFMLSFVPSWVIKAKQLSNDSGIKMPREFSVSMK